jgi:Xaa-Pro aminopeptidase
MTDTLLLHADSESDSNLLYATRFVVPDPVFWFRKGSKSYLVVGALELGRARAQATVDHVIDQGAERAKLVKRGAKSPRPLDVLAAILRDKGVRKISVPANLPVHTADSLRKHGFRVTVADGQFFPERAIKTKAEVAAIRFAQAATERAVEEAIGVLKESKARGGYLVRKGERVTSEMLKRVVDVALMRDGCIAKHTIIASGDQCVDPHDTGSGPIRPNTSIIFDVFPRHAKTGYFADMSRTVVRGKASKDLKELYALVEAGQQYAFDRIKHGANGHDIHKGIQKLFDDAGRKTGPTKDGRMQGFFHGTGHSVGLDIHEPPGIGARDEFLPAGSVVTVEPGLYYPGIGGVRLEDMVLVKKNGCENLTKFRKELEI